MGRTLVVRLLGDLAIGALALLVVACNRGGDQTSTDVSEVSPTASATATTTSMEPEPTPTVSAEDEITAAYTRYWEAYGQALLNLDPSLAEGVASGQELQRIREEIETFRSQGVALRVVVEHNPVIHEASESSATLLDEMVNNSFYVDPETKEPPVASGSGEILRDTFYFEKMNGQWMVVRSTRQR